MNIPRRVLFSASFAFVFLTGSVFGQGRPGDPKAPPAPPPSAAKPAAPSAPPQPASFIKNTPWTYDDILAALRKGADQNKLATAIQHDNTTNFYDVDLTRLRNTPEGQRMGTYGTLNSVLGNHAIQGGGAWTTEMARAAIAQRRAQTGRQPRPVDSQELRNKVAAGDPEALLTVYLMPDEDRKFGNLPDTVSIDSIRQRIIAANYIRGFWLVGDQYRNNSDKTKDNPQLEAECYRKSAEAGDPTGAMKLAQAFMQPGDPGVAPNYAEAEYWLIEAGARGPEGVFGTPYNNPERDLAMLYAYKHPLGGPQAMSMSLATDAELRWAREMIRRGGKLADTANVYLDAFELNDRTTDVRRRLAALPPEVAPFSADEIARLEAAARSGDVSAAAKLGLAYATGRGMHQDDAKATGYLRQAAEKGNGPAARTLAWQYANGYGIKKDPAQRVAWLQKAAEAGDASAWGELGDLQTYGQSDHGVPANAAAAFAAYQKGAAGGYAPAMWGLANAYKYGRGVEKNPAKAAELIKQAAEAGNRYAQGELADSLIKTDPKAAAEWYRKAIEAGLTDRRYSLARALRDSGDTNRAIVQYQMLADNGMVEPAFELAELLQSTGDQAGALTLFKKIAADPNAPDYRRQMATGMVRNIQESIEEQNAQPGTLAFIRKQAKAGDTEAMLKVAQAEAQTDRQDAMAWVREAANKGNGQAMLILAAEANASDKAASLEWLKKAAAAGNAEAKFRLGFLYFQGTGVAADPVHGVALLTESADAGFAPAQLEFGRALITGAPTITPDPPRGIEYVKKAAAQKMPQAAAMLGEIYETGTGVPANPTEALGWYQQAVSLGLTQAFQAVQRLSAQLGKAPTSPAPAVKPASPASSPTKQ